MYKILNNFRRMNAWRVSTEMLKSARKPRWLLTSGLSAMSKTEDSGGSFIEGLSLEVNGLARSFKLGGVSVLEDLLD